MTQAAAVARTFDQAGNVGHHELVIIKTDHAQMRLEGGEGVVGDLGLRRRHSRDERALPGVWEPHQGHIGHELEFEVQPALLTEFRLLGKRRRPATVREKPGVAAAALPTTSRQPPVPLGDQVGQHLAAGVADDGALRNRHFEVGSGLPVATLAHAVGAVARPAVGMIPEAVEGRHVAVGHQPDAAPIAAVPAIGATLGDVGLPSKRDRSGSAVTRLDVNLCFVDEPGHGDPVFPRRAVGDRERRLWSRPR